MGVLVELRLQDSHGCYLGTSSTRFDTDDH